MNVHGIDLYCETQGAGEALLLLAGFGCDHSFWAPVAPLLALLDSDIDRLALELSKASPDRRKVRQIVDTLKAKWALKEDEIVLRIKRLMAALEFLLEAEKLEPSR